MYCKVGSKGRVLNFEDFGSVLVLRRIPKTVMQVFGSG